MRPFRSRTLLLVTAACAVATCEATAAPAVPTQASSCPSLAHVTSLHGHAYMGFTATATGKDPDSGDTVAISLSRHASNLQVDLTRKLTNRGFVTFVGHAHGGHIVVDDTYKDTDSGSTKYQGEESYSGPLFGSSFGAAQLLVDTQTCVFKLHVSFIVQTDFSGSKEVQPGASVGGAFWSSESG